VREGKPENKVKKSSGGVKTEKRSRGGSEDRSLRGGGEGVRGHASTQG